jgi:hypothetical protein
MRSHGPNCEGKVEILSADGDRTLETGDASEQLWKPLPVSMYQFRSSWITLRLREGPAAKSWDE